MKDDSGQLRGYFNACPTVKLGILTDGLKYEFYADSDKPNMMDETAFLRLDLTEVAKDGTIDDNTLGGVAAIRSGLFNPEDVGAEAKRKLLFEAIVETVKRFKSDPSDDFIRFILGRSTVGGKISKLTQKIVDANRDVVRSAMEAFVAQEALARFGYAPKDVVRTPPERQESTSVITTPAVAPEPEPEGFSPSEGEMNAFNYTKNRLFYLVRTEALFQEVQKITFRKAKRHFAYIMDDQIMVPYLIIENTGTAKLHFNFLRSMETKCHMCFPMSWTSACSKFLLCASQRRVFRLRVTAGAPHDKGWAAERCGVKLASNNQLSPRRPGPRMVEINLGGTPYATALPPHGWRDRSGSRAMATANRGRSAAPASAGSRPGREFRSRDDGASQHHITPS